MITCEIKDGRNKVSKYPYVGKIRNSKLVVLFFKYGNGIVLVPDLIFKTVGMVIKDENEDCYEWVDEITIKST